MATSRKVFTWHVWVLEGIASQRLSLPILKSLFHKNSQLSHNRHLSLNNQKRHCSLLSLGRLNTSKTLPFLAAILRLLNIYVTSYLIVIVFIGNSTLFETKEKKVDQCQAQCLWMNFSNLLLNNNLDPMAKFIDLKNLKIGKQIIVR